MIAAIYARKSTEQSGVAEYAKSLTPHGLNQRDGMQSLKRGES